MVRHESAEALGAIDGRWEDCEVILREFLNDHDVVVRESCMVALDAADYWGHGGGGENVEDGEEEAEKDEEEKVDASLRDKEPLAFVKQKAITNGRLNHFNVAVPN